MPLDPTLVFPLLPPETVPPLQSIALLLQHTRRPSASAPGLIPGVCFGSVMSIEEAHGPSSNTMAPEQKWVQLFPEDVGNIQD